MFSLIHVIQHFALEQNARGSFSYVHCGTIYMSTRVWVLDLAGCSRFPDIFQNLTILFFLVVSAMLPLIANGLDSVTNKIYHFGLSAARWANPHALDPFVRVWCHWWSRSRYMRPHCLESRRSHYCWWQSGLLITKSASNLLVSFGGLNGNMIQC